MFNMEMNENENPGGAELRIQFLKGSLDVKTMTKEDFEMLFANEMRQSSPDSDVIAFCSQGLNQYDEYRKSSHQKKLYRELVREYRQRTLYPKLKPLIRGGQSVAALFLIVSLFGNVAAVANGTNVFSYDWWNNKDTILSEPTVKREGEFYSLISSVINETYYNIEEIDDDWLNFHISPTLDVADNFIEASYLLYEGENDFTIRFEKDEHELTLTIHDSKREVEKTSADEIFVEEKVVGDITFAIFTNFEDGSQDEGYSVIWEHEGFAYLLNAPLSIEEVCEIVQNYY